MQKEKAEEFKTLIEAEIIKATEKIAKYEELTKPIAPENSIGRISRMDAINNKSVAEAALRTQKRKLKNLEYALTQVHDKDFGLCARCKQLIPQGRLMLMPQSRFCVKCAQ